MFDGRRRTTDDGRRYWFVALLVCCLVGLLICVQEIDAQSSVFVETNGIVVAFPNTVDFSLDYSGGEIVSAVLTYDVEKFACVEVSAEINIQPDNDGSLEWQWVMSRSGNPPPGTALTWWWTLVDANGTVIETEPQTQLLLDERFNWQTVESERITLHWYRGNVGEPLLNSAETALDRLENDMGIQLTDEVEIWIYGSAQEMREAVIYISDWAGGVAFTEYNTILIGVAPSSLDWGIRTVAHELAHLVVGQFGRSCVGGSRPTWLEEGLAMVAEGIPDGPTLNDVRDGIEDNTFAPVRSLTGAFPAHGSGARSAYSQSYSVVNFMLQQYGADKMQQLITLLADGESYDEALETIYGLNVDGLETAWRVSLDAPARQIPPTLTPIAAESVPTYAPIEVAQDFPTPDAFSGTPFPVTETPAIATSAEPTIQPTIEPTAQAVVESPTPTDEAVAVILPTATPIPVTQATSASSVNWLMWAAIGFLFIVIAGLLAFLLRP